MLSRIKATSTLATSALCFTLFLTLFKDVDSATVSTAGSSTIVKAGLSDLLLKCSVSGLAVNETVTSFTWKFSGQTILTYSLSAGTPAPVSPWTDSSFSGTSVTAKLAKEKVTKSFKGGYECTVVLSTGQLSKTVNVEVQYKPEITFSGTQSAKEGQTVSITCNAAAVPSASSVSWKKGSSDVSSSKTLTLSAIKATQAGHYTCTATNVVGTTTGQVNVIVYFLEVRKIVSITAKENSVASVRCTARSNPSATLTIAGPGQSQSHVGNTFDYTVPTRCESTGRYTCSAVNTKYTVPQENTFNVTVLCSPRKDPKVKVITEFVKNTTESAVMVGPIVSYPSATFRWRKQILDTNVTMEISNDPGHLEITNTLTTSTLNVTVTSADDYAKYTLEAENSEGKTTLDYFLRAFTAPYQVTVLEEVSVTEDSLSVRWLSSFNGGSEQSFTLQYKPMTEGSDQGWSQKIREISDEGRNQFVYDRISGVYPGRKYAVRVFSQNAVGQSPYSDEIYVTTADVISFGAGIAVGLVIALILVAIVIGAIFVYLKKIKPARQSGGRSQMTYAGTNGRSNSTPGIYDGLEGSRERPTTYDDLKMDANVYQNVERKDPQPAQSQEKVYMNLTTQKSEEIYETPM